MEFKLRIKINYFISSDGLLEEDHQQDIPNLKPARN